MAKDYNLQMHTAEHILNQAMVRMFGCDRCFSAHINKKKSKCDYKFEKALEKDEIKILEQNVNKIILQDLDVTIEHLSRIKAEKEFNIERVPDKDDLEDFRIVRIADYDACPCIGEHVSSTKQIDKFKITTSDYKDGVLRIRFKLLSE